MTYSVWSALGKFIGDNAGHCITGARKSYLLNVDAIAVVLPISMVTAIVSPKALPSDNKTPANKTRNVYKG